MRFEPLAIAGAFRILPAPIKDERGAFARLYCAATFAARGIAMTVAQINTSRTTQPGTVRGLHFQRAPAAEIKIVRCVQGAAFDVIADLRAGSPTFGRWVGVELRAGTLATVCVPEGCAHGFQTLEPETELLYLHSVPYAPAHEGGVAHDDPDLAIAWPLAPLGLSPRDAALPRLRDIAPLTP
jgi:dTDP-4-dehydrorhamnose 3,5-epimerase